MPISSWDAAYYLGASLNMDIGEAAEIVAGLMPDEYNTDLSNFIAESVDGLDKKSFLTGAMVASIVMDRVVFIPDEDNELVACIICGNHKPVPATSDDEFGWVCSDCDSIYNRVLEMDMMKAIRRDEDELKAKHEHMNKGGREDEPTQR